MEVKQIAKSKTIQFNTIVTALIYLLPLFGVPVTPEITAAAYAVGNVILRFITKEAVSDK